tara:strand:- start:1413 stop:1913 length:501 start_codon:yes stop_codon:yes gene_type:complete
MQYINSYTKYKKLQNENVEFGTSKEQAWIEVLRQKYPNIKSTNPHRKEIDYSAFDATSIENGQKFNFELKTRENINHDTYPALYMGLNKIITAKNQLKNGVRTIFFWDCADGLYCWELTENNKDDGHWFSSDDGKEYYIALGANQKIGQESANVCYIWKEFLQKYN